MFNFAFAMNMMMCMYMCMMCMCIICYAIFNMRLSVFDNLPKSYSSNPILS